MISKLNSEINKISKDPAFAKRIEKDGLEPAGGTPEAFAALLNSEIAEWAEVVRQAKVTSTDTKEANPRPCGSPARPFCFFRMPAFS